MAEIVIVTYNIQVIDITTTLRNKNKKTEPLSWKKDQYFVKPHFAFLLQPLFNGIYLY